jgi:hypothetical protein
VPVKATAHTTPSRLTTVAHICKPNPPLPPGALTADFKAALSAAWEGTPVQSSAAKVTPAVANAMDAAIHSFAVNLLFIVFLLETPYVSTQLSLRA